MKRKVRIFSSLRKKKENHMDIIISNASGVPIYEQIEEQIKVLQQQEGE